MNSNVSLEAAKSTYGLIVAAAQIGSIIGPTIVKLYSTSLGIPTIYFMGALCMLILQGTMYVYICFYGPGTTANNDGTTKNHPKTSGSSKSSRKKTKAGILEGLILFYKYNYIKGIFAISCLFMILVTIVDYTLKVLARDHFMALYPNNDYSNSNTSNMSMSMEASQNFASFMGLFGQATNTLSLCLSLFGTSSILRTLGLQHTLLLFPTLCLCVILFVRLNPSLWVAFAAMMLLKASSYALNNPTKEILYQPTSSSVKYKAKSWIDIFGARGSKALGSVVTNYYGNADVTGLVQNGSLVGISVAVFLIWNAVFMGRKFEYLTHNGIVIGENENNEEDTCNQDDNQDEEEDTTSCGIKEGDEKDAEES